MPENVGSFPDGHISGGPTTKFFRNCFHMLNTARVETLIIDCSASYEDIGDQFGVSGVRIAQIAVKHGVRRPRGPKTHVTRPDAGLMEAN
jgi:hypothetical protein